MSVARGFVGPVCRAFLKHSSALAAFIAFAATLPNRAATVDDFQQNQATITGAGSSTQDGSMLGDERDLQVAVSAGAITAGASLGVLTVTGDGSANGTVTVVWDGDDNDATTLANTGLAGENLTAGGDNAFLLGLKSLSGSPSIAITVFSGANSSTVTLSSLTPSPLSQLVRVPYASIAGLADFADVGAIRVEVTSLAGATLEIDFLRTGSATAPTFEALLTDVVLVDNDANGKASAGDTLRYVVTIRNNDGTAKTAVQFNANIPANTTLVPGSERVSPLANDDSAGPASVPGNAFHTAFNTTLTVNSGDVDEDLLNNDFLGTPTADITKFGGGTLVGTVDSNDDGATATTGAGGHSLTVFSDGSFTYTPATDFAGLFTFQYRLGTGANSDTATVTIAVGERPNAVDETFSVTGNTRLDTSLLAAALDSVLDNDDGDGLTLTVNTAGTLGAVAMTTAQGASQGRFTFDPNRGITGNTTFSYTIQNGFGSDSGTVTLQIANMVWYVDVTASAVGADGRSQTPYNTIALFNGVNNGTGNNPADGSVIVLRDGTYTDSLTLRNNQRVIGDGWSGTFLAAAGFSLANGSVVAAFSLTDPVIAPAAGNGINLLSGNHLFGLTAGNTPAGFGYSGGAVGNLTIAECSKTGTGGAISITTSGTFGSTVNFDTLSSSSSTGANLNLVGVTGTLGITSGGSGLAGSAASAAAINISGGSVSLTYSGNVTKNNNAALLNVAGGHTGTLTFNTGTLNASLGTGLQFNNADGIYNFNGTTTLAGGDAGVDILTGSAGTFSFGTGATITSPTGTAFNVNGSPCNVTYSGNVTQASNAAMVSVTDHASGTITFQTGILSASNGTGLQFNNADSTTSYNFNGTTTLSGGDAGIDILTGSAGTFNFGTGTSISNPSGTAFNLNTSDANVTYSGSMTDNTGFVIDIDNHDAGTVTFQTGNITSTAQGLRVQNCNAGTINFNNPAKSLNTGANAAVTLASNTGATINFNNGGLNVDTTSGTAFSVTGGGTVNVSGSGNTIDSTTGIAFFNSGTGGSATIDINAPLANTTGRLIEIQNRVQANNLTLSGNLSNAGTGLYCTNNTLGTMTFSGGTKSFNTVANIALAFTNNTGGTFTFSNGGLDIDTTTGFGISAVGGGTINIPDEGNANTINSTGAAAISANGVTFGAILDTVTSGGGANNLSLTGIGGTLTMNAGTLSGASGSAFLVSGGGGAITYAGGITKATAGNIVNIASKTGGSVTLSGNLSGDGSSGISVSSCSGSTVVTFSGGAKDLNTAGSSAVNLANNTGATINFTGGNLDIDTTSGTGFTATGGGTVTVQGSNNMIDSVSATALNVVSTTIGSSGLSFLRISSGNSTAAADPANGIILNTTGTGGSDGGLTVTGDGGGSNNGSGGTIQFTTSHGISLNSTKTVSLGYMNVQNSGDDGIHAIGVAGFALNRCNVNNNGNSTSDDGLQFGEASGTVVGVTGAVTISNCSISGNAHNNVHVRNTSGTISSFTVTGSSFNDINDTTGANSFLFEGSGTSVLTAGTISGSNFLNNSPQRALEIQSHDTASVGTFTVSGNTFTENGIHTSFTQDTSSALTFKLLNNSMTFGNPLHAVNVFTSSTATGGSLTGTIDGNTIGTSGVANSGSKGNGIRAFIQGRTVATLMINNNTLRQIWLAGNGARGIDLQFVGPVATGQPVTQSDITLTNNDVDTQAPASSFPLAAIYLAADNQGSAARVRANISGNNARNTVGGGSYDWPTFDGNAAHLIFDEVGTGISELVDIAPASANAQAELGSHNTGTVYAPSGVALIAGPITTPP